MKGSIDVKAAIAAVYRLMPRSANLVDDVESLATTIVPTAAEQVCVQNLVDFVMNSSDAAFAEYKSILQFGQVFKANLPLAVLMVQTYENAQKTGREPSKHIGSLNHRDRYFVKCLAITHEPPRAGKPQILYKVETKQGDEGFFYLASDQAPEIGDCFVINATVKRHSVSNNVKQTLFRDVEIIENKGKK